MTWRGSGVRVAATLTVLVLISMGAFTATAFSDGGASGGLKQFNACITATRFLVLVRHGHGSIESVRPRAWLLLVVLIESGGQLLS